MARTGSSLIARLFIAAAIATITVSTTFAFAGPPTAVWFSNGTAENAGNADSPIESTRHDAVVGTVSARDGLTPVSAEVRGVPHGEQAAQMRSPGSIRADIARYNEERGLPRPPGRQSDEARAPANTGFRN